MWEFLYLESERGSFVCWPNNKIIDEHSLLQGRRTITMPMCLFCAHSHLGKSISEKLMKLSWLVSVADGIRGCFRSPWVDVGKRQALVLVHTLPHISCVFICFKSSFASSEKHPHADIAAGSNSISRSSDSSIQEPWDGFGSTVGEKLRIYKPCLQRHISEVWIFQVVVPCA